MSLQGDYGQILAGMPMKVEGANIAVRQPKVQEIIAYGETEFLTDVGLFTNVEVMTEPLKKSGDSRLQYLSDFQILMSIIENDSSIYQRVKRLFDLIFSDYVWKMDVGCFMFATQENGPFVGRLVPQGMEAFASVLKTLFIPYDSQEVDYNPANGKAREIAEKLKKGRQKRNELKQMTEGAAISLLGNDMSVLSIGLGVDVNTFLAYTPFQLYDAFSRYTKKTIYDFYQRVASMPFMDVSKMEEPDNWLDNIYK